MGILGIAVGIADINLQEENKVRFTISDPAHPESYLFGGNSLLYDTDTISTIGFCTETESGKKKVEVYLFTEEQEYYITNPNYTQNKMESFEQLKAYIAQG